MGNSNAKKSATLGMPHGTATHRLRKQILFGYVQKCGDDVCFKCGNKIETVDDLSIEHKEPWEGRDASKFWDLSNIAFSHLRCNTPHHRPGSPPAKHGTLRKYQNGCRCLDCKVRKSQDNALRKKRGRLG